MPGVFCDELQEAYFGAAQGDKVIRDFIGLARRAPDAIESCSAFSVVASELSRITGQIDELVREALRASAA
ncbi:MAG TPA: hypothetical protein VNU48_13560 [Burkholderiaceae bacterium]|nr:hypothetical protein [Burkholderiaceae bacterium]